MKEEIFWILLSKKLAGEASQAELLELAALLESNPEWRLASESLSEIWSATPHTPRSSQQAHDAYLSHIVRLKEVDTSFEMVDDSEPEIENIEDLLMPSSGNFFTSLLKQPKQLAALS